MTETEANVVPTQDSGAEVGTANELRSATKASNRNVALALIVVALLFLAGAFGVALLVVYGPI